MRGGGCYYNVKKSCEDYRLVKFISSIEYKFAKDCFNHLLRIDNARDSYYIINALEHVSSKIRDSNF